MTEKYLSKVALAALLCASITPAFAQWPAGTPREDTGARPSPMGNPAPQEKLETHRNEHGQMVTEDGRVVKGMPEEDSVPNRNMSHTEVETTTEDPPHRSASPGEIE